MPRQGAWYEQNKDRLREQAREYMAARRKEDPEWQRNANKRWRENNPQRFKDQKYAQGMRRKLRQGVALRLHDQHVRAWTRHQKSQRERPRTYLDLGLHAAHVAAWSKARGGDAYRVKYRSDVEFRLKERLRRQLRKKTEAVPGVAEIVRIALQSKNGGSRLESLFGYTLAELRRHLERQFTRGMSWEQFGKNGWHIDHIHPKKCFDISTIDGLRAYWALPNLRPLPAKDNLAKRSKVMTLL